MTPRFLLHLEGGAVLTGAVLLYFAGGGPWWLFLLLILAPDLAMVGYAAGPGFGSRLYNVFHTYLLPLALLALAYYADSDAARSVSLVWLAHIGMDRLFGYGLKYPTGFKDTHLNRL